MGRGKEKGGKTINVTWSHSGSEGTDAFKNGDLLRITRHTHGGQLVNGVSHRYDLRDVCLHLNRSENIIHMK